MTTTLAYNPEQNGVDEGRNSTIMNSARAALTTDGTSHAYWPWVVSDAAFKHKMLPHSAIVHIPLPQWAGSTVELPRIHEFGLMGCISNLSITEKLQDRGRRAQYVEKDTMRYTRLQQCDGRATKVRDSGFHPVYSSSDPIKKTIVRSALLWKDCTEYRWTYDPAPSRRYTCTRLLNSLTAENGQWDTIKCRKS